MKSQPRQYTQQARAASAAEKTERILQAALDLFVERPFDQITLAGVAERAEVGLQTVIRRVGTKDGLVEAVGAWVAPQVAADLGEPDSADPVVVAAAFRRHYSRWAPMLERSLAQADTSPALHKGAEGGRAAHRDWIAAAFGDVLAGLPASRRALVRARLVGVTGVELWLVLTKHEGLTDAQAEQTIALLIQAALQPSAEPNRKQLQP